MAPARGPEQRGPESLQGQGIGQHVLELPEAGISRNGEPPVTPVNS